VIVRSFLSSHDSDADFDYFHFIRLPLRLGLEGQINIVLAGMRVLKTGFGPLPIKPVLQRVLRVLLFLEQSRRKKCRNLSVSMAAPTPKVRKKAAARFMKNGKCDQGLFSCIGESVSKAAPPIPIFS
jgi:hypothetical protein